MIPKKILWYLGYNNLGIMLEQERKHWLLKTDKRKQVQDKISGDIYEGEIDNRGSDIKVRTSKLPIKHDLIPTLKFTDSGCNRIFGFENAAFPFSMGSKGLMFARIESINYPLETNDELKVKNYRIVFNNAERKILAFGISPYSSEVYSGEWISTTTPPVIQMMDDYGDYSISVDLILERSNNVRYYYPIDEGLQPFSIEQVGVSTYQSESINDDGYIGYPLMWFSTEESRTGPTIELGPNGHNSANMDYMLFSTDGNAGSMYKGNAYVCVDGTELTGATPDLSLPRDWEIRCHCYPMDHFNNTATDFYIPINYKNIYFYKKATGTTVQIPIISGNDENNVFTLSKIRNLGWVCENENTYKIGLESFVSNNKEQSGSVNPLLPIFDIALDESIPYYVEDNANIGYAGIEFTACNPKDDIDDRYPHKLDQWSGLPGWFDDPELGTPQHMAIYAIHNTPSYSENNPESRQTAALLLDPGKMKLEDSEELTNDERGRVYVLSNDEPEYVNNSTAEFPKPGRTVARICDIPTSISDFLNVEGLVPISIVDPKYVRSQAAYTETQKNKLWNILNSKVVTPMAKDTYGVPLYDEIESNPYIFSSLENLKKVDLIMNNDFREWINLNSYVDPTKVSKYSIANPGTDYVVNATGIIVIGGTAMNYVVTEVDSDGGVTDCIVVPQDSSVFINLSNFDMVEGSDGITQKYGTMPAAGNNVQNVGEGLELVLKIEDYDSIRMKQGNIYDDLVAFVYEGNYLKMYRYITNPNNIYHSGYWGEPTNITYFDQTNPHKTGGGYSNADALTRTIVPYLKTINVCSDFPGRKLERINAMTTPTFINIVDTEHSPIHLSGEETSELSHVDLCGFHCDGFTAWIPFTPTSDNPEDDVMEYIKSRAQLDRDCYLIWKWKDDKRREFKYGIIRRSMCNYVTTDTTTTLPPTKNMKYDSYIHTNDGTTVVWDVPEVGVLMWVYNQHYNRKEAYNIDQNTRDLYISYSNEDAAENPNIMTWDDIDIRYPSYGQVEKILDSNGKFNFYIYTNNPVQGTPIQSSGVYNEYEFKQLAKPGDDSSTKPGPVGNWQLVFPRVNQYKIVSSGIQGGVYNTEVKLRRLVPLNGEDLGTVDNVLDSYGHNVNSKVVLFDHGSTGTKMKIYNKETNKFETV